MRRALAVMALALAVLASLRYAHDQEARRAANRFLIDFDVPARHPDNAATLQSQPDVDGALVGGASLVADQFLAIVRAGRK